MNRVLRTLALLAVSAGALGAQVANRQFSVTTRLGTITPERSASLETAGLIGLDTEYSLSKYFGIGTTVDVSRGYSTKEDFLTRLRYGNAGTASGDSIYYQYVGQPVGVINVSGWALARYPGKRLSPYVMGGVGNYTMVLDAQVMGRSTRANALSYTGGAGVWVKLGDRVGVQLDARSVTYTNYNRDILNPALGRPELATPFPEDFPVAPAKKNSAMNTVLTLGFRYLPGGGN